VDATVDADVGVVAVAEAGEGWTSDGVDSVGDADVSLSSPEEGGCCCFAFESVSEEKKKHVKRKTMTTHI
jgi:hypothetical protein